MNMCKVFCLKSGDRKILGLRNSMKMIICRYERDELNLYTQKESESTLIRLILGLNYVLSLFI